MVLLKLLHIARTPLSPYLLTLQLLMPTKMSSTAWLTSHTILSPTLVRHSVWVSTLTAYNSTCVAPCVQFLPSIRFCAVHRSELTNGKIKSVSPMLKVLKECPNPRKYFDPDKFLEALQLDSLLPRKEVDTSLYVTNRAKLEQMFPYLFESQNDAVTGVVYSTLKYLVSEEDEARAVRDKCKQLPQHARHTCTICMYNTGTRQCRNVCHQSPYVCVQCTAHAPVYPFNFHSVAVTLRTGWNALKDCLAIRYINVERLAQKLLPLQSMAEWMEKKDNWERIVVELCYFLKLKAEKHLTRPRVVHALLVTGGHVKFINDVMSAGKPLGCFPCTLAWMAVHQQIHLHM